MKATFAKLNFLVFFVLFEILICLHVSSSYGQSNSVSVHAEKDTLGGNHKYYYKYLITMEHGLIKHIDSVGSINYEDSTVLLRISPSPDQSKIGILFSKLSYRTEIVKIISVDNNLIYHKEFEKPIGRLFISNDDKFCCSIANEFGVYSLMFFSYDNSLKEDSLVDGLYVNCKYSNSSKYTVCVLHNGLGGLAFLKLYCNGELISQIQIEDPLKEYIQFVDIEINEESKIITLTPQSIRFIDGHLKNFGSSDRFSFSKSKLRKINFK